MPERRGSDSSRPTDIRLPSVFSALGDGAAGARDGLSSFELARAIDAGAFRVYFQPEFAAGSREVKGCESLVRLPLSNGDVAGPDQIIPLAEQTGLITALGTYVMSESLAGAALWTGNREGAFVGVNVSRLQLNDPAFVEVVERAILNAGIDPARVLLEVTESAVATNPEQAIQTLLEARMLGVRIAVDDFGTGHSSLTDLFRLPADVVKIAGPMVSAALRSERALIVLEHSVDLLKELGFEVVAEGIESEAHAVLAEQLGCDFLQGYYLARPAAA